MGTIAIREYGEIAESHVGQPTLALKGPLLTDMTQSPIKVVTSILGTPVDAPRLTGKTHWVVIEPSVNVRYAIRPKNLAKIPLPATQYHPPVPAGSAIVEAVYPNCIISFLEF